MFIETRPSWNEAPEERNIPASTCFWLRSSGAKDIVDVRVHKHLANRSGESLFSLAGNQDQLLSFPAVLVGSQAQTSFGK